MTPRASLEIQIVEVQVGPWTSMDDVTMRKNAAHACVRSRSVPTYVQEGHVRETTGTEGMHGMAVPLTH